MWAMSRFSLFSYLWAVAALFHCEWDGVFQAESLRYIDVSFTVVSLAALWLLLRPSSLPRLVVLAAVGVIDYLMMLPQVPNHWTLFSFVNIAVLVTGVRALKKGVSGDEVIESLAPVVRCSLAIVYSFAFFWKLNSTYLTPETSCAVAFYGHVRDVFTFAPEGPLFEAIAIWFPIFAELLLVALLLSRRWLDKGILLGFWLHVFFALDVFKEFVNFSSVMIALLVLSASGGASANILVRLEGWKEKWAGLFSLFRRALPILW